MHRVLLGLTALATIGAGTPAQGRDFDSRVNVSTGFGSGLCASRVGERRRAVRCQSNVLMDWDGGEWAYYNNRSFAPDSFNGWWNERPDRAYPAWMRRNGDCQRQWYSGDVLRC